MTRCGLSAATLAYVSARVSSARALRSPLRRTSTSSGTSVITAPNCRSSIAVLLACHRQGYRLGRPVAGHVHRIHHVPDQEEAPAARLLLAGELALDIGLLGVVGDRAGQGVVGDAHDDRVGGGLDLDVDRNLGPTLR